MSKSLIWTMSFIGLVAFAASAQWLAATAFPSMPEPLRVFLAGCFLGVPISVTALKFKLFKPKTA